MENPGTVQKVRCDNPPFGIKWSSKGKSESGAKLLGDYIFGVMLSFDHTKLNMVRRRQKIGRAST